MSEHKQKVRVAIAGVGNCASSLVQGVEYYKDTSDDSRIPGLMHAVVGGYHVRDIEFSAAFVTLPSLVLTFARCIAAAVHSACVLSLNKVVYNPVSLQDH